MRLDFAKKIALSIAGTMVLAASLIVAPSIHAQAPAKASPPEFEVASVRVSKPGEAGALQLTPGRFRASNLTLLQMILFTYNIRSFQVSGDRAGWIESSRYDIDAKAESASGEEQTLLMLRTLLEDRFRLRVHRETKEGPVYVLTIGKNGIRMQPASCVPPVPEQKDPGECGEMHGHADGLNQILEGKGVRIANSSHSEPGLEIRDQSLVRELSIALGRTVIDRTGLTGTFDMRLTWARDQGAVRTQITAADAIAPSIFTAVQEQLGLKLESAQGPVEYLMIDHAERPSEN